MTFTDDLHRFARKVEQRKRGLFLGTVTGVEDSVTEGSAVTGAPGQPVDTGVLKGSWIVSFPGDWIGDVTTNLVYAPPIEDGVGRHGPLTLRSKVGGFHSVKLTRANFDRIVDEELKEVVGA